MAELTPPQIFDELMADKSITVSLRREDLRRLHSYLKVIKSRNKKLYTELGFDYDEAVIKYESVAKIEIPPDVSLESYMAEHAIEWRLWLEKPTPKATYNVIINDPTTPNSTTDNVSK